jgi:hypothetical protein
MIRPGSKKFVATRWQKWLVPLVLVFLVISLVVSILIVLLS